MPGPVQSFTFDFLEPMTEVNDRKLPPGRTTNMVNTRRTIDGAIEKRLGFDRTAVTTFVGGSYVGPATQLIPGTPVIVKDSGHQLWAVNGDTAYFAGHDRTAMPSHVESGTDLSGSTKPASVLRDGKLWEFTVGNNGALGGLTLTITDLASGTVVRHNSGTFAALKAVCAVLDASDNVWLFGTTGGTTILAEKYTSETASAVDYTFHVEAGAVFTSLDAMLLTSTGQVVVAATSFKTAGGFTVTGRLAAILNTATGASSSSAFATNSVAPDSYPECCNGVSVLDSDGADGYMYVAYWRTDPGVDLQAQLVVDKVQLSSLSTYTQKALDTASSGSADMFVGVTGGWQSSATALAVLASVTSDAGSAATMTVDSYQVTNMTSVVETNVARSAWLASKPFERNGVWYFLSGYDSGNFDRNQLGYYLHDSDGNIFTPALDGDGSFVFFAPLAPNSTGRVFYTQFSSHTVRVHALSDDVYVTGLLKLGTTPENPLPARVSFDFAPTVFSSADNIVPGGVPKFVSSGIKSFELSPLIPPHVAPTITNEAGPGTYSVNRATYRYAQRDPQGNLYRSSPYASPVTFTFLNGSSDDFYDLILGTNRHVVPGAKSWIEIYGSVNGQQDLYLQQTIPNDPSVDTVTVSVAPLSWDAQGELLDTTGASGGVLDQSPAPQAKLAFIHGDRLWLAGTPDGEIWYSQRRSHGKGWEFNEVLVAEWHSGTGEETAGGSLNEDTAVIFKRDAIGTISGPGPDGLGNNGYSVLTAPGRDGCTNPASLCAIPDGMLFQRHGDGRLCLFNGRVQALTGQEHLLPFTVTGVVHDSTNRLVDFHLADGRVLQLQMAFANVDNPLGALVVCQSDALTDAPAVGALLVNGVPTALEAGDVSSFALWTPGTSYDDDGEEILKDFTTTRMAPAGIHGEFDADGVYLSTTNLGGSSEYVYTLTSDYAVETHDDDVSVEPDVHFRANAAYHTREVKLRVQETSATGRGRRFDGVTMEYRPLGRTKRSNRKVA